MSVASKPKLDSEELALRLRRHSVRMCSSGHSSHVGSALSVADIVAVLYGGVLRIDAANPEWQDRDRFILSKGHAAACVYAALAETGFFPTEQLAQFYQNGSYLSGHVSHTNVPGVEFSTGSLGHGLGVGTGMAFQLRRRKGLQRVYVVMSDGECDEGSVWEAAMFAAHHKISNLCAIIDSNKLQSLGPVDEAIRLEPFADKWRAFGWNVLQTDGHDHSRLKNVFALAGTADRPTCIIADTIKGRGVSFMENQVLWHYRTPQGDEFAAAMRELGESDA